MFISFVVGILVGAALLFWRNRYVERQRRRIPASWPLKTRPLVNTQERRVWIWLTKVMFDQHILIKLPVTRFTAPDSQAEATHWYKLLNGVYCTFTICSLDGRVIGCVDVPGPNGLSMGNQTLKHSLLDQCSIRYVVVDPSNLPHLSQIRAAFLGEQAARTSASQPLDSRFQDVREHLHAVVTRRRQSKGNDATPSGLSPLTIPEFPESRLASGWELNSFVSPLDSRLSELKP
ncbi:MAG: hypothetical protein K2X79_02000 [Burkholderiaceae bacterium]|nr:hypothetical protein [Burkholderiaceae bacterium]